MSLELSLWEATRPAYRVRYVHDPAAVPRVPLYASYGFADAKTARAKLARIVRRAPEVMVKVTGRPRGASHLRAHLAYIGRRRMLGIETRDGELLTDRDEIAERAVEWADSLQWRERPTVSAVSMIFSMPAGTDPDKVLGAVRAVAEAEFGDNHDYMLVLHTDTPRPHVHVAVQAEGLDRNRFNPRPPDLTRFRERFARELRARGIVAEATPRRARGRGVAGSSMALTKLRARLLASGGGRVTDADRRTNEQAVAVARGERALPAFVSKGSERWQTVRRAYRAVAEALNATGVAEDRALAASLNAFLDDRKSIGMTPEIFAGRHRRALGRSSDTRDRDPPRPPPSNQGRSR